MIYEIRTYRIAPRSLAEVEKRFGEAYEYRKKYSELFAFWHNGDRATQRDRPRVARTRIWAEREAHPRRGGEGPEVEPRHPGVHPRDELRDHRAVSSSCPRVRGGKLGPIFELR